MRTKPKIFIAFILLIFVNYLMLKFLFFERISVPSIINFPYDKSEIRFKIKSDNPELVWKLKENLSWLEFNTYQGKGTLEVLAKIKKRPLLNGEHKGKVEVYINDKKKQSIKVLLSVKPIIGIFPESLELNDNSIKVIEIKNSGSGILNWEAKNNNTENIKLKKISSNKLQIKVKFKNFRLNESKEETVKIISDGGEKEVTIFMHYLPKRFINKFGMEFVYIKKGNFLMGSSENIENDEKVHPVDIKKDFYIQVAETTQKEWQKVMKNNPSHFKECGEDCPVENVSWLDTQKFMRKLSDLDSKTKYRLPTEEEWEYASRGGVNENFIFGRCLLDSDANFNAMYPIKGCKKGLYRKKTLKVKTFKPNNFGLYDVHGNVSEWTASSYDSKYEKKESFDKIVKGGSWFNFAIYCRSANRNYQKQDTAKNYIGFRSLIEF